jgi:hypothetical protein
MTHPFKQPICADTVAAHRSLWRKRTIMTKADEDAIREIELRFNEAWEADMTRMLWSNRWPTMLSLLPSTAHGPRRAPTI